MKMYFAILAAVVFGLAFVVAVAYADQEAGSSSYVCADSTGRFYVRAVPEETYAYRKNREAGITRVYRVAVPEDKLLTTYNWYAPNVVLAATDKGVSVIRFGPWPRGHKADNQLAIAFYLDGKLLKSYSTLDIAGTADNVSFSVSHYTVIQKHYRNSDGAAYDVETTDGRIISFDPMTGEIISTTTKPAE